eukprot:gene9411-11946_t
MKKVLITGTAGFIGFHLANRFLAEGFTVAGLDIINDYYDTRVKYGRLTRLGFAQEAIQTGRNESSTFPGHLFYKVNLCDKPALEAVFEEFAPDVV